MKKTETRLEMVCKCHQWALRELLIIFSSSPGTDSRQSSLVLGGFPCWYSGRRDGIVIVSFPQG